MGGEVCYSLCSPFCEMMKTFCISVLNTTFDRCRHSLCIYSCGEWHLSDMNVIKRIQFLQNQIDRLTNKTRLNLTLSSTPENITIIVHKYHHTTQQGALPLFKIISTISFTYSIFWHLGQNIEYDKTTSSTWIKSSRANSSGLKYILGVLFVTS